MKKQDLELLIQAGDVKQMVISRDWAKTGPDTASVTSLWEVWAYGGPATSARGNVLQTARGERRWFRTLDTAHDFIRECGFRDAILLEERFISREEDTGP